ncbi:19876_t:CDS:1, partial [Cetraspora pellucida]
IADKQPGTCDYVKLLEKLFTTKKYVNHNQIYSIQVLGVK